MVSGSYRAVAWDSYEAASAEVTFAAGFALDGADEAGSDLVADAVVAATAAARRGRVPRPAQRRRVRGFRP